MARNSQSLFESVDNVTVFKSDGIGLTHSLPQDDGTLATTKSAAECMPNYDNRIVGGEHATPILLVDKMTTHEGSSNGSASVSVGPGDLSRKLLTMRRKLVLNMKQFLTLPKRRFGNTPFESDLLHFVSIREGYEKFRDGLNELKDSEALKQLIENVADSYESCVKLFKQCESRFNKPLAHETILDDLGGDDDELEPCDSASQITSHRSVTSATSSVLKRIELERKKAELRNLEELSKLKLRKAELRAKRAQAQAEAEAERAEAEIEEAETLARLRLENANLEAEEKILACSSQSGSDMRTFSKIKSSVGPRLPSVKDKISHVKPKQVHSRRGGEMKLENPFSKVSGNEVTNRIFTQEPVVDAPNLNLAYVADLLETKPHVLTAKLKPVKDYRENTQTNSANAYHDAPVGRPAFNKRNMHNISQNNEIRGDENTYYSSRGRTNGTVESSEVALHTYLERQGRNEYINLASQIGYDGTNSAFIFYENRIRRLMDESPYDDRKLEVLRASCTGQPREMVNLFCVPMKNVSTSTRIEKALDRLRQRYGVSGGLTSEPKIIAIRNGPKVLSDLNSLKMYNEDLNTLEIFAMAHDEVEKLSGQLFLDTASRLPHVLKQRYLDYLNKKRIIFESSRVRVSSRFRGK